MGGTRRGRAGTEPGDLQQRKMARSGRAEMAAALAVRAVTSTGSVHPSSAVSRKGRPKREERKDKCELPP